MSTASGQPQPNADASTHLRSLAERIVRLKGEVKNLQIDIKEVKAEAAGHGFDRKALEIVVKRMMEDESEKSARQETEALADLYLASLGMLDGTPLGDATRRRADAPPPPPPAPAGDGDDGNAGSQEPDGDSEAAEASPAGAMGQEEIDAARAEGEQAAVAGAKVFANPYVAGDPRRAAWDEGWCRGTGSDGMDLPAAFRRKPKPPAEKRSGEGR
ncbi:DUF2312 domain-containing protein [Methylorubrum thiocyanatum]